LETSQVYVGDWDNDSYINVKCLNNELNIVPSETAKSAIDIHSGFGLKIDITNYGIQDLNNIQWSVQINCPLILLGSYSSGVVNIPAGTTKTISIPLII